MRLEPVAQRVIHPRLPAVPACSEAIDNPSVVPNRYRDLKADRPFPSLSWSRRPSRCDVKVRDAGRVRAKRATGPTTRAPSLHASSITNDTEKVKFRCTLSGALPVGAASQVHGLLSIGGFADSAAAPCLNLRRRFKK
jgi:hypothetical protein